MQREVSGRNVGGEHAILLEIPFAARTSKSHTPSPRRGVLQLPAAVPVRGSRDGRRTRCFAFFVNERASLMQSRCKLGAGSNPTRWLLIPAPPNIEAAAEPSPGVWQIPNICTSSLNFVRSREIPRYHQHAQGRRATAKLGLLQGGEGSAPVRPRADASILRRPQAVALSVLDQGCWKVPMAFTHDKDLDVPRRTLASAAILSLGFRSNTFNTVRIMVC